ncbi:response regulator transcription factor [Dysgonomonas sp. OttesenSCG-928-M03]|nr:response regulator transcription factor [Dysgonomonas sp. OttesenSCG-928-M03]
MRNLIIADKQDITSAGIRYIVDTSAIDDIGDVYLANDKALLIELLSKYSDCVIILDYTLFDFSSITELQILQERYPESSWMLFSDELSDSFFRQILANDLSFTIVFKSNPLEEIEQAIRSAFVYIPYLGKNIENHLNALRRTMNDTADYNLTSTEKEILKDIALGKTTKEIAAVRNVSFHTVMTHRKNIFRKLGVNNVHEATKYAMKAGIVDLSEYYI